MADGMSHEVATPRHLVHPGPVAHDRVVSVPTVLVEHRVPLPAGAPLLVALESLLDRLGAEAAVGRLEGGALAAFDYCIPALGRPQGPVATFSDPRTGARPGSAPLALRRGGLTVGRRDGDVFAHSHARWTDPQDGELAGHLLPDSVVLADGVTAHVVTSADALYEVVADPETTMNLFMPRSCAGGDPDRFRKTTGLMCRVRPNMDLCTTIESLVDEHDWPAASVWGQVGSLVGAHLVQPDGSWLEVDGPATEVICLEGIVVRDGVRAVAHLEAEVVDRHGRVHRGHLVRGMNLVAMTYELTLRREPARDLKDSGATLA